MDWPALEPQVTSLAPWIALGTAVLCVTGVALLVASAWRQKRRTARTSAAASALLAAYVEGLHLGAAALGATAADAGERGVELARAANRLGSSLEGLRLVARAIDEDRERLADELFDLVLPEALR